MAAKKASAKSVKKAVKKSTKAKALVKEPFKAKMPVVKEPLTKNGILMAIMQMTGLPKKSVSMVLDTLGTVIELHVKKPGKFTLPGLLKISVVKKAARPARDGINPFTGEKVTFKAKPAHKVVKIRALRKLKEMAV